MESEFSVERFAASFQRFIEHVNKQAPEREQGAPKAGRRVSEFLGVAPERSAIAKATFRLRDLPTIQLSVEELLRQPGWDAELLGYTVEHDMNFGMAKVLAPSSYDPVREGPPVYATVELPERRLSCLERGLYLISSPDGRAALLQHVDRGYRETVVLVEAVAATPDTAQAVVDRIREIANEVDVLKRSVISLGAGAQMRWRFIACRWSLEGSSSCRSPCLQRWSARPWACPSTASGFVRRGGT